MVNLRSTIYEEGILKYENESSYSEYGIDENDPDYEYSAAEAIDNWLGK